MSESKNFKINNVQQYLDAIDKIKSEQELSGNKADLLFRGQQKDWVLLPKIARLANEHKLKGDLLKVEELLINEFERRYIPFSEFTPSNKWDLLALAQHHGLPTRLLDWTYSSLSALWFAVEKPSIKNENAVVWVLAAVLEDFQKVEHELDPFLIKKTVLFRPGTVSHRISAQSSVFTVHRINSGDRVVKLQNHVEFKGKLTKLIIPALAIHEIRTKLHIMGVNASTIFPDLDGLCKHLQWRFSFLDDEKKVANATIESNNRLSEMNMLCQKATGSG